MYGPRAPSPSPPRCRRCSAVLASAVGSDEVVTVWDLHVTMRRQTDFVLCQRCLELYPVADLRQDLPSQA